MDTSQSTNFRMTREAARMLGISLRTAQLWVENGTLEAWKTEGAGGRQGLPQTGTFCRIARALRATPGAKARIGRAVVPADVTGKHRALPVRVAPIRCMAPPTPLPSH
jgi:excisionase family DNA binding protein